jgi:hypothetical protein
MAKYMVIGGMKFEAPSDFESLVEDLCDTDGFTNAIVVHDTWIREVFEKAGLLKRNIRGGCYGTEKLRKNREAILAAYYEEKSSKSKRARS